MLQCVSLSITCTIPLWSSTIQEPKRPSRIQIAKRAQILDAALEVFSVAGFRGSTLDQIADEAGISKPNLLYYFDGKEEIHITLLDQLLDKWLDPLRELKSDGEPLAEILDFARRKLFMAKSFPRESRLFANEILRGAPQISPFIASRLKNLVDEKASLIKSWSDAGHLAPVDPHHLIFSIWSTTQHYADFEVQVRVLLNSPPNSNQHFADAEAFLTTMLSKTLKV